MNRSLSHAVLALAGVGIVGSLLLLLHPLTPSSDIRLTPQAQHTLSALGKLTGYELRIETSNSFPDKTLSIEGTYGFDHPAFSFSADSTTTITTTADAVPRSFSLKHMVFSDDLYTAIASEDPLLARMVPVTRGWQHFKAGSVPRHLTAIATHGPIVDPLLPFRTVGVVFTPLTEPTKGVFSSTTATMYRTAFSAHGTVPSALRTLEERLGATGTVDIYFNEEETEVLGITFKGPTYYSTTTILKVSPPALLPPTL
jgi:hypothetical protein